MGVDDLGVGRHDLANLLSDLPYLQRVGPDHAELYRETDWRTKEETIYARTCRRHRAVRDGLIEPLLHPLARFEVLGDDDNLGKIRIRQHRIEAEPESRRSLADIARIGHDVGIVDEQPFRFLGGCIGHANRGALGQAHFEEQFGARRGRKELLLHQAEAANRQAEHQHGDRDDRLAPVQAGVDYSAQQAVYSRVVDYVRITVDAT